MASIAISLDANPNPNLSRQVLRVSSQKNQGYAQVNKLILGQVVQNLDIAKMSLRTETSLIWIIYSPILPLPKASTDMLNSFIKWFVIWSIIICIYLVFNRFINSLQ